MRHETRERSVSGAMAAPVGRFFAVDTRADDHVEPLLNEPRDHRARARRIIGRVPVGEHINVSVHIGEHAPHHIALALMRLATDDRTRGLSNINRAVG